MAKKKATKKTTKKTAKKTTKAAKKTIKKAARKTKRKADPKKADRIKPADAAKGKQSGNVKSTTLSELHRNEILQMFLQGSSINQISLKLKMEYNTVLRHIQRQRAQWRDERFDAYDEIVDQCVARNEHIMSLAFEAYFMSREGSKTHTKSETTQADGVSSTVTDTEQTPPTGDVRFLQLAERCNFNIAKIHGLIDVRRTQDHATEEDRLALIEIVVTTPEEVEQLKTLTYQQLETSVIKPAK